MLQLRMNKLIRFLKGKTNPAMHYLLLFQYLLQSIILTKVQAVFIFLSCGHFLHLVKSSSHLSLCKLQALQNGTAWNEMLVSQKILVKNYRRFHGI